MTGAAWWTYAGLFILAVWPQMAATHAPGTGPDMSSFWVVFFCGFVALWLASHSASDRFFRSFALIVAGRCFAFSILVFVIAVQERKSAPSNDTIPDGTAKSAAPLRGDPVLECAP